MKNRVERLCAHLREDEAFLITNQKNIFYLSGFTGEGLLIANNKQKIIITDFRYLEAASAIGNGFTSANIACGIENIISPDIKTLMVEEDSLTVSRFNTYKQKLSHIEFVNAKDKISSLRIIKDKSELKNIKTAADIATFAFEKTLREIKPGISERQIAFMFEYTAKKQGASALSFDTIVASGENSSMPHAIVTERKLGAGDFVTMDFGCVYNGYCSDMTRTVAIGNITDEQKKVYDIVLAAQQRALNAAISGASCKDVDAVARDFISAAGYGDNFGHSLGHGVGIDIHEFPTLSSKSDMTLKDGMVVTIEPGIYLAGKFGIRIEDLIIINSDTPVNLSNFTKELLII